jgi:nitrite reductase/ring-hydroxylating ferredoxin subunit/uncharacterized membrane protein
MSSLTETIAKQSSLDKVITGLSEKLNKVLEKTGNKKKITDLLNGVWLGHPLHPALVSVPCGCWTAATILDTFALRTGKPSRAAAPVVAIGVLGGIAAAAPGLADWDTLTDQHRRIGLVHAAANAVALVSYTMSLLFRVIGAGPARFTGYLGFIAVSFSGYLGGDMVYRLQGGVAQLPAAEPPDQVELPLASVQIAEGQTRRVEVGDFPVMVARSNGRLYAIADLCPHLGCSLADGSLNGGSVVCNCHGSRFDLADGSVLEGPATTPVRAFEIQIQGERALLRPRAEDA